jgi:hypothetical protein
MEERIETISQHDRGASDASAVPRVASGIHSADSVIDVESRVGTEPSVGASEPQSDSPNAVITPDGIQELPPWLIGSDGKPLPLTEDLMRKLRHPYFTVRHDVAVCGHKVDRMNQPKRNCHICWWAFFQTHETLVKTAHEFYQQYGKERLIALRGRVFVKFFLMFMSTVQHILEQQREKQERNESTGIDGQKNRAVDDIKP